MNIYIAVLFAFYLDEKKNLTALTVFAWGRTSPTTGRRNRLSANGRSTGPRRARRARVIPLQSGDIMSCVLHEEPMEP